MAPISSPNQIYNMNKLGKFLADVGMPGQNGPSTGGGTGGSTGGGPSTLFGKITEPQELQKFNVQSGGIGKLLNLVFQVLIIVGGIYAIFNFILAGYAFLSAGDDPKKAAAAWAKIYQSAIGLLFMAGAFLLAALFSQLIFGDWHTILNPSIPTL